MGPGILCARATLVECLQLQCIGGPRAVYTEGTLVGQLEIKQVPAGAPGVFLPGDTLVRWLEQKQTWAMGS